MASGKKSGLLKRLFKGFSLIRKIAFVGVLILILGLLIYIVAQVISKDIAKLVGADGAAQSGTGDYQFLSELTNSGYSEMLNANELVEYYAFEYAVLMDAARFMEETGTKPFEVINSSPIDFEELRDDGIDNRKQWALMAAMAFCKYPSAGDQMFADSMYPALGIDGQSKPGEVEPKVKYDLFDSNYNADISEFNTQHSKENLFYYPVYNEYTQERALIPYLEITRNYDIVRYYIEYKDDAETPNEEIENAGINGTFGTVDSASSVSGSDGKVDAGLGWAQASRFEFGTNPNYNGLSFSYDFILNHLFPLHIVQELNGGNGIAYERSDASYNGGGSPADLYKEYSPSLYYTTGSAPTNHKIQLKILLDRFLPNAVLMSSWRMLNDDTKATEDIVDEIQKIYSEACLEEEKITGENLLVKDVNVVQYNIDSNTEASQLFNKLMSADSAKGRYLDGKKTSTLYNSYEALFDSRIWEDLVESGDEDVPGNNTEPDDDGNLGDETSLQDGVTQKFEGTFKDDVMDDIKLVLTHYSENFNIGLTETAYEKLLDDADRLVNPNEGSPTSVQQVIIYTPEMSGGYMARCVLGVEDRSHYDSSGRHRGYQNPASLSVDEQACFPPFMKIAYTQEKGLRKTAIILYYNGEYKGYVVKGKEIPDYSKLTNEKTFAYFESRDMSCTTVRHWKITTKGEQGTEKWFVEDAFEGLDIELGSALGDFILRIKYTRDGQNKIAIVPLNLNYFSFTEEEKDIILNKVLINDQAIVQGENTIKKEDLAVIRQCEDTTSRDYTDEMKTPPSDPSIQASDSSRFYGGSSTITGGETIILNDWFLNLKKFGLTAEDWPYINTSNTGNLRENLVLNRTIYEVLATCRYVYEVLETEFDPDEHLSDDNLVNAAVAWARAEGIEYSEATHGEPYAQMTACDTFYAVVFPTRRAIIPITQEFWDKQIRFYLVKGSKLWSSVKEFQNTITVAGEYRDRSNFLYIVNSNPYCKGLDNYVTTKKADWRGNLFAPVFAGNDSANTSARETDVLLILSEWLEASEQKVRAADHFIRDLYALINYSKGILNDEGTAYAVEPIRNKGGEPYINPGSYTYLYIPDEILLFDDTTSEKAFWLDRLICTPSDPIDQGTENYLRSQAPTFTWQIVDYDLYEECRNSDGTARVYPLWMFGDQMSRTFYALASNTCDEEHQKVFNGWGGYASGMHAAADLYGRNLAKKIYNEIFKDGSARITSEYFGGGTELVDTENTDGDGAFLEGNEAVTELEEGNLATIQENSTEGIGLYFNNIPVNLILEGKDYKFSGTAAAVYGYELYRQTLILKDGKKAEELLKAQLEDEMKWTELRAVAPGIITEVKADARGGFTVRMQHSDNAITSYLHMKRYPLVQIGQYVGAGTLIGYEGTTGNSGTFHVHFTIRLKDYASRGESQALVNPVTYMYPFFTPFYYAEKAEEAGYKLDSEYMSTTRTVFPYGQVSGVSAPNEWATDYEGGIVKIKNYVPYKVFLQNSEDLYNEDSGFEKYVDYSKLPTKNVKTNIGPSKYRGDKLETTPYYFNRKFIEKVADNGNKISGVTIDLLDRTILDSDVMGDGELYGVTFGFATDKKVAYADYAPARTSHNPYYHAHYGIDIKDAEGSPIYAAADGEVLFYSPNGGGNDGIYVMLKHNNHVATTYCHMQSVSDLILNCREEGAQSTIRKGDIIGYMGSTGTSSVHLHIRLSVNESGSDNPQDFSRINPNPYFPYTYEFNPGGDTFTGEL